jgi:hypothetical protein
VRLPVDLTWTIRDFTVKNSPSGRGGAFAVFVDRAPVPPGKTLSWLAREDASCTTTPGCPDTAYLAKLGVYRTTATHLTITALPPTDPTSQTPDRHEATIILLDDNGKRIGETAFVVTFKVKQKG